MKNIFVLALCAVLALGASSVFARAGFSGGGGGPVIGYDTPDLGELNSQLTAMGVPKFDDGLFLYGGKGYGYINRNFRIGGMGAGGSTASSALVPGFGGAPDLAKEVTFDMGYGGVTLEYVYDAPWGIQLFAGGLIGWGGVSLRISQYDNALSWNGIWDDYHIGTTNDSNDQTITLDNSLFILNPWVGGFVKILPWMGFSGQVGYFYSKASSENWQVVGSSVIGAPDLDLSNVNFEIAIVFGG